MKAQGQLQKVPAVIGESFVLYCPKQKSADTRKVKFEAEMDSGPKHFEPVILPVICSLDSTDPRYFSALLEPPVSEDVAQNLPFPQTPRFEIFSENLDSISSEKSCKDLSLLPLCSTAQSSVIQKTSQNKESSPSVANFGYSISRLSSAMRICEIIENYDADTDADADVDAEADIVSTSDSEYSRPEFKESPPAMDLGELQHCFITAPSDNFETRRIFLPSIWFSSVGSRLLDAFVNGFVDSISPQLCHSKLSPAAIFIPLGSNNPFVQHVFQVCGTAFLSNVDPSYVQESRKEYSRCLLGFANELSSTKEPQEWMVATMLLLCLRDKIVGEQPKHAASHLAKAFVLLRHLLKSKKYDVKNLKFLIESFLFNYSVILLVGGKEVLRILPSPFKIFDDWRRLLDLQIYLGTVPWLNNPVFGAAARAFELAAKVSWLVCEHPLDTENMTTACDLLVESCEIEDSSGSVSQEDLLPDSLEQLQNSMRINEATVISSKIVLYKLLNPELQACHPSIQKLSKRGHTILAEIPMMSKLNMIAGWSIFIIGLCAMDASERNALSQRCVIASTSYHVAYLRQIEQFLDKIWGLDHQGEGGLDYLFGLQNMCL